MTRWLSLEEVVDRIIKQWPALLKFLENLLNEAGDKRKKIKIKKIYDYMSKIDTKCYFLLLSKVLYKINSLNTFFQHKDAVIHSAPSKIKSIFKNIAKCIIDHDYVNTTEAEKINIYEENVYLAYEDYNLGDKVVLILRENELEMETFCIHAFNFILSVLIQMRKQFDDMTHEIFDLVDCLNPKNVLSEEYRQKYPSRFNDLVDKYYKLYEDDIQKKKIYSIYGQR